MESYIPLSYSQQTTTDQCPEPDESSPYTPILLRSILIFSFHLILGLQNHLLSSDFPIKQVLMNPSCVKK